jgi:hypothetical protein
MGKRQRTSKHDEAVLACAENKKARQELMEEIRRLADALSKAREPRATT